MATIRELRAALSDAEHRAANARAAYEHALASDGGIVGAVQRLDDALAAYKANRGDVHALSRMTLAAEDLVDLMTRGE